MPRLQSASETVSGGRTQASVCRTTPHGFLCTGTFENQCSRSPLPFMLYPGQLPPSLSKPTLPPTSPPCQGGVSTQQNPNKSARVKAVRACVLVYVHMENDALKQALSYGSFLTCSLTLSTGWFCPLPPPSLLSLLLPRFTLSSAWSRASPSDLPLHSP